MTGLGWNAQLTLALVVCVVFALTLTLAFALGAHVIDLPGFLQAVVGPLFG